MKYKNILKLAVISSFTLLASCGDKDKHDDHAGHDHKKGEKHDDHAGHNHKKGEKHDDKDEHAGHDHKKGEHDHSQCGVVVGPKGGRMIEKFGELNLTDKGELTFELDKAQAKDTQVRFLVNNKPVTANLEGSVYKTEAITDKLPAKVHVSIKNPNKPADDHLEELEVEAGKCTKCNHKKISCTCNNHEH